MSDQTEDPAPERPLLRIVGGDPTDHELAALLAVVAAYAAPAAYQPDPAVSAWSTPTAALRRPLAVGPGAWSSSGWMPGVRTRAAW